MPIILSALSGSNWRVSFMDSIGKRFYSGKLELPSSNLGVTDLLEQSCSQGEPAAVDDVGFSTDGSLITR
jgi:hypothetical protein